MITLTELLQLVSVLIGVATLFYVIGRNSKGKKK